jgi:hypothetical protein
VGELHPQSAAHPDECRGSRPREFPTRLIAADVGVYESLDLGGSWSPFAAGLPNAMVVDLLMHKQDRMLMGATRNRGALAIQV